MKRRNRIKALLLAIAMIFSSSSMVIGIYAEDTVKKIYTMGGAHLDTSWIWTLETTIKQFLRNTLTGGEESASKSHVGNFYLMDNYPDYKFNLEGAYRYELIKEYYPDEWEKVKDYIAKGQWNTAGSMYENGDVTVVSPEALIRNILYGNQFFADEFGNDSRTNDVYLPDAFGYGYVLPSVAAHCGLDSFIGLKLHMGTTLDGTEDSLKKSGKTQTTYQYGSGAYIPFTSGVGVWVGPDGNYLYSAINTSKVGGYGGSIGSGIRDRSSLENVTAYGWNGTLAIYGTGDRGGSPTEESVQNVVNAMKLNSDTVKVYSATLGQWVEDLTEEQKAAMLEKAYDGELLMNQHGTGSYTVRSISHRWNSRSELLAGATESASVLADWLGTSEYPHEKLTEAWKRVIMHQFHDDITGTSNRENYVRNWNDYIISLAQFADEYENALSGIASLMDTSFAKGTPVVIHNPVGADRNDTVTVTVDMCETVSAVRAYDSTGAEIPTQLISTDGNNATVALKVDIPSMGYKVYDIRSASSASSTSGLSVSENSLSNDKYIVTINENGDISSIYDKTLGKELLASPIVLGIFDDTEGDGTEQANGDTEWPAWEIRLSDYVDKTHKDYVKDDDPTITIEENGAARVAIRVVREYKDSKFDQVISLEAGDGPVKVDNNIEWHEDATLLKAIFNTTASNEKATYDLGLGTVERTTNTAVQGEVPAQKWADITDESGDFGISILSDSKNGWDKYDDSTLRLTLLHTPYAKKSWIGSQHSYIDFGENNFSFAISSHAGLVGESDTQKAAQFFTEPMTAIATEAHSGSLGSSYSFASVSDDDIIIRAIKQAETGVGLDNTGEEYIVRFNEGAGRTHGNVTFTMGSGIASVRPVYGSEETIPEDELSSLSSYRLEDGKLIFDMKKFEIRSFVITLVDPSAQTSASESTSKAISLDYNVDIISSNENKDDTTLDGLKTAFPAELLPSVIEAGGVSFNMGSSNDGENNALRAEGQTITLPSDCNKLYFLAFSTSGDKKVDFKVGDEVTSIIIGDYLENIGSWEMYNSATTKFSESYIKEQKVGFAATHHHENDEDAVAGIMYMFKYELDIPSGATSVTLPNNRNIIITAMSASSEAYETQLASELYDSCPREYSESDADVPSAFYLDFDDEDGFDACTNTALSNGGVGFSGTWSSGVTTDYSHSGTKAFKLEFNMNSTAKQYCYSAIYKSVNIPVTRGTYIEYWLYTGTEDAKYVNIELTFSDGTTLRDGQYYDSDGVKMHPAQHATAVKTVGEWTKYRCALTEGKTISAIGLALDTGSASHGSNETNFAVIDDIYIGDGLFEGDSDVAALVTTARIAEGIDTSSYPEYGVNNFNAAINNAKKLASTGSVTSESASAAIANIFTALEKINDEPPVEITINSLGAPTEVNRLEAFVLTVKTNTNTAKITLTDGDGKTIKPISTSYTDDIFNILGDERTWTLTIKLRKTGSTDLTITASDASGTSTSSASKTVTCK